MDYEQLLEFRVCVPYVEVFGDGHVLHILVIRICYDVSVASVQYEVWMFVEHVVPDAFALA